MKEVQQVGYTLHGVNPPTAEFRGYYEDRNGGIAQDLATYMGLPFCGHVEARTVDRRHTYIVPVKTVDEETARLFGIETEDDFYGAKARCMDMVGKSILHPTQSMQAPDFYSPEFAEYVRPLVLPGITIFTKRDAQRAFQHLVEGGHTIRVKLPNASDGNDQYTATSIEELENVLAGQDDKSIQEHGLVLEACVQNPQTVSVGYAILGEDIYSFIARQKNDVVVEHDEKIGQDLARNRYTGAIVRLVRGNLSQLLHIEGLTHAEKEAIEASLAFCEAYKEAMGVVATRLSFDYLHGVSANGKQLGGITDITARLGGTCPAIMVAAHEFKADPGILRIDSEVTLNYNPNLLLPEEQGAKRYIDRDSLRLTARVNARHHYNI